MLRGLRSIWLWAANVWLILLWTAIVATVRLFDRDPLRRRTARTFRRLGPVMAMVNPWRVEVSGVENADPARVYVIVSNHQSLADIPVITHLELDTKWLGKAELFRVPLLGWMLRMAGDVPVERGHARRAAKAMLRCARYLREGCSVVFFPEGTRSRDGAVLPFNEGPFQLAIREQAPILPLVVEGSGAALPRNTWLFGGALTIRLRVLPAVPVEGRSVKETAALRDEVRGMIVAELEQLRK
uniref:1-acyl-sn-glycerol-3-phosphate acyltransferase n=1 Tax=Solibacter usitatus (strain Ellin6076) TaxID=234267 RepID=Q01VF5_SOLUE